ncbi:MAG: betaine/proline/choline family ABC transporter ATP-binding protein [Thermanaeromonas sp.]|uniref:betaine/proline/choline family ABC transporter ATP-binding protein n=1 Tax=Thermanaeromonas sp. TaxID=2003697 RepID=UPI002437F9F5|nr:betaine/proline/choline family ABC transporter ATP-binding protein [Thermanaeromonas sp.]MCG0278089.1 betaine/proline/choline family ABC transporter ATP-binding protein [Thermanaeromonas sp.]
MIKLEGVTKIFPRQKVPAVKNLSMEVAEGEICVLVGPSGCGKTTTMKMINRLIEPTEGKIYVNGRDVAEVDPIKLRQNIGYVIQEIGLFPHMTIAENIATVPREKGWPEDKIQERVDVLLELVGLDPEVYRNRKPADLSGGQRQRVGVARALAADPPILLMDEPFGAVDPITRAHLQNEFLSLQKKMKKTIMFVTHDIDEAIKMGDKIAVMRAGELVQYDTPDRILSAPADDFVVALVGHNRALKRLNLVKAGDVARKDVPVAKGTCSLEEAKKLLQADNLPVIVIVDGLNRPRGVAYKEELLRRNGQAHLQEIMTPLESVADEDATLYDALSTMLNYGERYVVVMNHNKEFQGIITFGYLLELMKENGS